MGECIFVIHKRPVREHLIQSFASSVAVYLDSLMCFSIMESNTHMTLLDFDFSRWIFITSFSVHAIIKSEGGLFSSSLSHAWAKSVCSILEILFLQHIYIVH